MIVTDFDNVFSCEVTNFLIPPERDTPITP